MDSKLKTQDLIKNINWKISARKSKYHTVRQSRKLQKQSLFLTMDFVSSFSPLF